MDKTDQTDQTVRSRLDIPHIGHIGQSGLVRLICQRSKLSDPRIVFQPFLQSLWRRISSQSLSNSSRLARATPISFSSVFFDVTDACEPSQCAVSQILRPVSSAPIKSGFGRESDFPAPRIDHTLSQLDHR